MKKRYIVVVSTLLLCTVIAYSYRQPGHMSYVDTMRVYTQGHLVTRIDDSIIGQTYTEIAIGTDQSQNIITRDDLGPMTQILQTGDIIFTRSQASITSLNTPGYRKHIAIYLGDSQIIDSTKEGVSIRNIQEISHLNAESILQDIVVVRLPAQQDIITTIVDAAKLQLGKDYDYDLRLDDSHELYCSELIAQSLQEGGIDIQARDYVVARTVITPQNIYNDLTVKHGADIVRSISS